MESGFCTAESLTDALTQGDRFVAALGCTAAPNVIDCINAHNTSAILHALPSSFVTGTGAKWGPVIDGVTIVRNPLQTLRSGQFNQVPLLLGTNTNEATYFVYPTYPSALSAEQYTSIVGTVVDNRPEIARQYLALFPPVSGDNRATLASFLTDWLFRCPTHYIAMLFDAMDVSAYLYRFNHAPNCSLFPANWGVYHTAELSFVFDHPYPRSCNFTSAEETFASNVGSYWASMASRGSPNFVGSIKYWPSFHLVHQQNIVLDLTISVEDFQDSQSCSIWMQVC